MDAEWVVGGGAGKLDAVQSDYEAFMQAAQAEASAMFGDGTLRVCASTAGTGGGGRAESKVSSAFQGRQCPVACAGIDWGDLNPTSQEPCTRPLRPRRWTGCCTSSP